MYILPTVLHYLGLIVMGFSGFILLPIVVSVWEGTRIMPFILSFLVTGGIGWMLWFFSPSTATIHRKEGILIAVLSWVFITILGGLPFLFANTFGVFSTEAFIDAWFEATSGFTTTGVTVIHHVESLSGDLLLWRATAQWLGGVGIIVLAVAILPYLGVGGLQLYKAEVAGPTKDKLHVHVKETARTLWKVYVILTALCIVFLLVAGMPLLDAVCHGFSALATGGFSTKNSSVGAYGNPAYEWILMTFMILGGTNFTLHYNFRRQGFLAYLRDEEFKTYIGILLGSACLVLVLNAQGLGIVGWHESIRASLFQVTTMMTTTGYSTVDYGQWPIASQVLLVFLMVVGSCAGSTGGAIKVVRVVLLLKHAVNEMFRIVHPQGISVFKFNGQPVSSDVMRGVLGFVTFYVLISAVSVVAITACGVDFFTAVASVFTCIGNVGAGFGTVGPHTTFAIFPSAVKVILTLCMLIGRLEVMTFVVVCIPEYWRK